eukprot:gene11240-3288_t
MSKHHDHADVPRGSGEDDDGGDDLNSNKISSEENIDITILPEIPNPAEEESGRSALQTASEKSRTKGDMTQAMYDYLASVFGCSDDSDTQTVEDEAHVSLQKSKRSRRKGRQLNEKATSQAPLKYTSSINQNLINVAANTNATNEDSDSIEAFHQFHKSRTDETSSNTSHTRISDAGRKAYRRSQFLKVILQAAITIGSQVPKRRTRRRDPKGLSAPNTSQSNRKSQSALSNFPALSSETNEGHQSRHLPHDIADDRNIEWQDFVQLSKSLVQRARQAEDAR